MRIAKQIKGAILTLSLVSSLGLASVSQATTLRVSSQFPGNHSSSAAIKGFAEDLSAATENRVKLNLYTDSQLGGQFEMIDQVRTGQVDIDVSGPEWYGRLVPDLQVLDLPFLVTSYDQAFCMIDGKLGDRFTQQLEEKNLVVLGWMVNGFRHVSNNVRPIKTVADMDGLKIRTPPSNIYLETFRALGANPMPIDIKELYQALQQGVVDGQENPYDNIELRGFHEVQEHLSNTSHFYAWVWIVANKRSYDKLSEGDREVLHREIKKHVDVQRKNAADLATTSRNNLIDGGMTYTEISSDELAKFRDRAKPVYELIRAQVSPEVYDLALESANECQ